MINFIKKLFGKKNAPGPDSNTTASDEEYEESYALKEKALEQVLGKMHGLVGHAIVPFQIGGAVDMYYFPNHIEGTGFATMELIEPDGTGPKFNNFGTYELVAFTRHPYTTGSETQTPFDKIERHICGIFTRVGNFSYSAVLKPGDTCELPMDDEETICLVFDNYKPGGKIFEIAGREHHLLLCMELFRSEMDFSRKNGSDSLFELLKEAGYYPYSDMDRKPVV